jgi:arylsulfatase A-like enzyme
MNRRQFLKATAATATALFAGCSADDKVATSRAGEKVSGSRPNIVFILSDDMGWAEPGFNGGNAELTPNIDRLASDGLRLSQFYTHSVCAPTRSAFLTGRYAFRNWMDWRSEDFGKPSYLEKLGLTLAQNEGGVPTRRIHALDTDERTIAEALRDAGYFTAILGKWHAGEWLKEHLPMQQGFMHQYGHYAWGIDYYDKTIPHNAPARFAVYDWHRNEQPIQEEGYTTDLIAAEAERVIAKQNQEQPFFLYIPFNAVHGPIDRVPRHTDKYAAREAALKCLDDAVGHIVAALERYGFADNTLLVFTNDNGGLTEEMNKPYRGTKNTTFEGGVRVPCVIRWPGHTPPGTASDGMMFIADFFSTFITIAGGRREQRLPVDSFDMTGMLFAGEPSPRDEIVFEVSGSVRIPTIRKGDYKLMGKLLFNIKTDPSETTNIAAQHPEIVKRLRARLLDLCLRNGREREPTQMVERSGGQDPCRAAERMGSWRDSVAASPKSSGRKPVNRITPSQSNVDGTATAQAKRSTPPICKEMVRDGQEARAYCTLAVEPRRNPAASSPA